MKYDICLTMPLYYYANIEADTIEELKEKVKALRINYEQLFKDFNIENSGWEMTDDNDISVVNIVDENGEELI